MALRQVQNDSPCWQWLYDVHRAPVCRGLIRIPALAERRFVVNYVRRPYAQLLAVRHLHRNFSYSCAFLQCIEGCWSSRFDAFSVARLAAPPQILSCLF